jgi:hypothetical protein
VAQGAVIWIWSSRVTAAAQRTCVRLRSTSRGADERSLPLSLSHSHAGEGGLTTVLRGRLARLTQIVATERKEMAKAQEKRIKKDFWGAMSTAMSSKSPAEKLAQEAAERQYRAEEVTEDPGVRRRRLLLGVQIGHDLEEPGALEAALAQRSQGAKLRICNVNKASP